MKGEIQVNEDGGCVRELTRPKTDWSNSSSTWPVKTNPQSSSSMKSTPCADPEAKANQKPPDE